MPPGMQMPLDPSVSPSRAFLRGLGILLKSVRLYGPGHQRTSVQMDAVWKDLRAIWQGNDAKDLTLGVAGSNLLLNGVRLEANPNEQSLVQLLGAAGLTSIQISSAITREELARFIWILSEGTAKPVGLAERLRAVLRETDTNKIRINEIRFVAQKATDADPGSADAIGANIAAQVTAGSLVGETGNLQNWLNDPIRLLEVIAAAQGAQKASSNLPAGASTKTEPQRPLAEEDLLGLFRLLTNLGVQSQGRAPAVGAAPFAKQLSRLSSPAQATLRQALSSLAAAVPSTKPDSPGLIRLAEHLAIRFALERYESGEVRVDSVRQLLERLSREVASLRKVLRTHEERMTEAGLPVESYMDILDRQFWSAVPASGKRSVLLSPDGWCIPPRNIRQFLQELVKRGDASTAESILRNYAACVRNPNVEARRKAIAGLLDLADLYAQGGGHLLDLALSEIGWQAGQEPEPELQTLLGDTLVRIGQEAVGRRLYHSLKQALGWLESMEKDRRAWVQNLRRRMGVIKWLTEFVEEALRAPQVSEGLVDLLRAMPDVAAEQLAGRLLRCHRQRERERLVGLAQQIGTPCAGQLCEHFANRPVSESVTLIGLLSRLDVASLEKLLPACLQNGGRAIHDEVLRQLAIAGTPERGRVLLGLLELLDPLVLPRAVEGIGVSGDLAAVPRLMRLAEGQPPASGQSYVRAKAIEALGQLHHTAAVPLLRSLVEAKQVLGWSHPKELRIVAAQALAKIDPGWAQASLRRSGLEVAELAVGPIDPPPDYPAVRQRYYPRLRPSRSLGAIILTEEGKYPIAIKSLSLGGGLAACMVPTPTVIEGTLKIQLALRPIAAKIIARNVGSQQVAFEIVDIEFEERWKLRRLLASLAGAAVATRPSQVGMNL